MAQHPGSQLRWYSPTTVVRQVTIRQRRTWADESDVTGDGGWSQMSVADRQQRGAQGLTGLGLDGRHKTHRRDALLSSEQLWAVYLLNGDVFAAVNGIARRVSTQDRRVVPTVDPDEDPELYQQAVAQAAWVAKKIEEPNEDDDFRTFWEKVSKDALVLFHGPYENVMARRINPATQRTDEVLAEFVPAYGASIWAKTEHGTKVVGWLRDPTGGCRKLARDEKYDELPKEAIDRLVLQPNNRTPYGTPPIEVAIREITTLIRFSERTMWDADRSEIPLGFLVLTGHSPKQAQGVKKEREQQAGLSHKIPILHSMGATSPAQWVRIQPDYQQIAFREVTEDARKVVWRVFGVTPIEMGSTEDANRASSQVELEVGNSHLVEPMLEAIAGLINRKQIPLLIKNRWRRVLCKFEWDTDEGLTPSEDLDRAKADDIRLKNGSRTLNEVRDPDGYGPLQGGDAARIEYTTTERLMPVSEDGEDPTDDTPPTDDTDDGEATTTTEATRACACDTPSDRDDAPSTADGDPPEQRSPACRLPDETVEECVARKVPEILDENPDMDPDQAVAIAHSVCETACSDETGG